MTIKDAQMTNVDTCTKITNEIVLCREDYDDQYDFENAIQTAVMLLLNSNYIMTVRYDEKSLGIVVIEFSSNNLEYGDVYPYWLDAVEYCDFKFYTETNNKYDEECDLKYDDQSCKV